jgi:hypothetical protein
MNFEIEGQNEEHYTTLQCNVCFISFLILILLFTIGYILITILNN